MLPAEFEPTISADRLPLGSALTFVLVIINEAADIRILILNLGQ
jgi:hypothetical protein